MGVAKPIVLMLDGEEIRAIPGFRGYFITKSARVISSRGGVLIEKKPQLNRGYMKMVLEVKGVRTFVMVHRLLMLAFHYKKGCHALQVDHINGNRTDNRLENLQWVNAKGNALSAMRRNAHPHGVKHGMSKFTEEDVLEIRRIYKAGCPINGAKALSNRYRVHKTAIECAVFGRTWAHLPGARTSARAVLAKHFPEESK